MLRKWPIFLAVLLVLGALAGIFFAVRDSGALAGLSVQTQQWLGQKSEDPNATFELPENPARLVAGALEGPYYYVPYFNLRIGVPPRWELMPASDLQAALQIGRDLQRESLLNGWLRKKHDRPEFLFGLRPQLTRDWKVPPIVAATVTPSYGWDAEKTLRTTLEATANAKGVTVKRGEAYKLACQGKELLGSDLALTTPRGEVLAGIFVCPHKNYTLTFTLIAGEPETYARLKLLLSAMDLRDTPNVPAK